MSITNHVAILTRHALAAAVPNKEKENRLEFYTVLAFPPSAMADLGAVAQAVAGATPLGNFEINVKPNAQAKKPIPGVPGDWLLVRAATQYPPYVADAAGVQLSQGDAAQQAQIRSTFFAGKRVRAALSAFKWNYKGKDGISFNIDGVMDAGEDGERLAIGNGAMVNAFAAYANPNAVTQPAPGAFAQSAAAPAAQGNPFGGAPATQTAAPAASANPFAQAAPAANANPFATTA